MSLGITGAIAARRFDLLSVLERYGYPEIMFVIFGIHYAVLAYGFTGFAISVQ